MQERTSGITGKNTRTPLGSYGHILSATSSNSLADGEWIHCPLTTKSSIPTFSLQGLALQLIETCFFSLPIQPSHTKSIIYAGCTGDRAAEACVGLGLVRILRIPAVLCPCNLGTLGWDWRLTSWGNPQVSDRSHTGVLQN